MSTFRYPNFLGSLNVSNQDFSHPKDILFITICRYPNNFCTNITTRIFYKNITRAKGYSFVVCAVFLIMANFLAIFTNGPAITLHKSVLCWNKGFLPFLGNIPKALSVQGEFFICPTMVKFSSPIIVFSQIIYQAYNPFLQQFILHKRIHHSSKINYYSYKMD
jgi:hypothetical protein